MQHCVFSYVTRCVHGESSIFTLTKQVGTQAPTTLATIEVRGGRVVQARGRANRKMPAAAGRAHAALAGAWRRRKLTIATWV